jgi:kinesin family member 22
MVLIVVSSHMEQQDQVINLLIILGKTYTMQGDKENPGIVPNTAQKIFEEIKSRSSTHTYKLTASFIEIYNEKIRDLLVKNDESEHLISHKNGETLISNIKLIDIDSIEEFYKVFEISSKNRSISKTDCNERSSRSHS